MKRWIAALIGLALLIGYIWLPRRGDEESKPRKRMQYLSRRQGDHTLALATPEHRHRPHYPWDHVNQSRHPKITKDYFRCKGSLLNPVRQEHDETGELTRIYDCGGAEKHSLPMKEDREYIYPVLVDLLNYIQEKTDKRVVITSGHRCPQHNTYADPSTKNQFSKHQIGAEVAFYVQGMENQPDAVVALLTQYYKDTAKYDGMPAYLLFKRYDKDDVDVKTAPWMNQEIFIKLYKAHEGRNFDNRHPYPYISIQVRYDWDTKERVAYSWPRAHKDFRKY